MNFPLAARIAIEQLAGTREVTMEGRVLRARVNNGASAVPVVLAALESAGAAVAAITVARPSLDDVYLQRTGRSFAAAEDGAPVSTLVVHTGYLTGRLLRAIARQPAYVIVLLIQPIIWLVLFGQLFKAVVDVPGFGGGSYIDFLHPRDRHHDRALLGRMGGDGVHR